MKRIILIISFAFLLCVVAFVYSFVPVISAPLSKEDLELMYPQGGEPPLVPLNEYFFIKNQYSLGHRIEKLRF